MKKDLIYFHRSAKMEDGVASDSSFYICFGSDLKRKDWLRKFVNIYSFYAGKQIKKESISLFKDENFNSSIKFVEFDYYELIKPFLGRDSKHMNDGEYEAIGIAHFLESKGCLKYLIIDDLTPRNFVTRHFPDLGKNLVGTIGFIRDCCCEDKKIKCEQAIEILNSIKESVEKGEVNRPCSMDIKNYKEILIPAMEKIRGRYENEGV